MLTYFLADVYAWTIDFTRLDKGDRFKVIYTEKFVDDSISVGIEKIKAAYFEHRGKGLYAYEFETDSIKGIIDYFDDNAKNLRRAFLKAPVKFSRISSRYNLKRRIAYYGRVKPHKRNRLRCPCRYPHHGNGQRPRHQSQLYKRKRQLHQNSTQQYLLHPIPPHETPKSAGGTIRQTRRCDWMGRYDREHLWASRMLPILKKMDDKSILTNKTPRGQTHLQSLKKSFFCPYFPCTKSTQVSFVSQ